VIGANIGRPEPIPWRYRFRLPYVGWTWVVEHRTGEWVAGAAVTRWGALRAVGRVIDEDLERGRGRGR
jgi:hypothetical protein